MDRELERKRLVELTNKHLREELGMNLHTDILEKFADHLLDNGIVVPPVKVGEIVYRIVKEYNGETRVIEGEVFEVAITHSYGQKIEYRFYFWAKGETHINRNYSLWCNFDEAGKTVFTSREEAVKMLKGEGK